MDNPTYTTQPDGRQVYTFTDDAGTYRLTQQDGGDYGVEFQAYGATDWTALTGPMWARKGVAMLRQVRDLLGQ